MKMIGKFSLLLVLTATAFAHAPLPLPDRQLLPRDEAVDNVELSNLRNTIITLLDKKDYKGVAALASSDVRAYYDAPPGRKELIRCLRDEGLDRQMKKALAAGGTYDEDEEDGHMFIAPSLFRDFPDDLDYTTNVVVYGTDVNIRSRPDIKSEVVTQLSYTILEMPEWEQLECESGSRYLWHRVKLPDGRNGYIAEDFMWTTGSPRFHFREVKGKWRLEFVMSGA